MEANTGLLMSYVAVVGLMIMIVIGAVTLQKATNAWLGRKWELYAVMYVLVSGELMTNKSRLYPFDVRFEDTRVNVKSAKLKKKKHGLYFDFRIHDHYNNCDFFLLIGYMKKQDKNPVRIWFIPAELIHQDTISISRNPKRWKGYEIPVPARPEKGAKRNESKLIIPGAVNRSPEDVEQYACSTGC